MKIKSRIIFILLILAVFLVSGIAGCPGREDAEPVRKEPAEKEKSANIVKHTSEGFKPVAITVNVGDTVTWTNEADEAMWPATDIHPIHRNYPGSDMKKCGTPEEKETFDSCRAVGKGESYSFTFSQKGSWNYHNHRSPSEKGVVVVLG